MRLARVILFLAVIPLLAPACCTPAPVPVVTFPDPATLSDRVWLLDTATSTGSAFPVANVEGGVLFVTAHHLVRNSRGPFRLILGSQILPDVRVHDARPDKDLAVLLAVTPQKLPLIRVRREEPEIGERLVLIGYPLGELMITSGFYCGEGAASTPAVFGNSGGPALDEQGRAVGVLSTIQVMSVGGRPDIVHHMVNLAMFRELPPIP